MTLLLLLPPPLNGSGSTGVVTVDGVMVGTVEEEVVVVAGAGAAAVAMVSGVVTMGGTTACWFPNIACWTVVDIVAVERDEDDAVVIWSILAERDNGEGTTLEPTGGRSSRDKGGNGVVLLSRPPLEADSEIVRRRDNGERCTASDRTGRSDNCCCKGSNDAARWAVAVAGIVPGGAAASGRDE